MSVVIIITLLVGCNNQTELEDGSVVHDEQTSADNYNFGDKVIEIADNMEDYEKWWDHFNYSESRPEINFEESSLIFLQTTENSCPKEIDIIEVDEEDRLIIETAQPGTYCDDIGLERSFVLEVEKDTLKKVENIWFEGEAIQKY